MLSTQGASFGPRKLVAGIVLCAALVIAPALPATANVVCQADECDNGAWAAARGAANELSYWGMSPGHNCTNYVAWRLISAGVERPRTHPGNAADWASRAIVDGYRVDKAPAVGSVAQWVGGAAGYSVDGHVALVEQINDDGTILVSEDFWNGGAQTGPLTYRTVDPATVSNFIHYGQFTAGLREVLSTPLGWQLRSTRLDPALTDLSAIQVGVRAPEVFFAEGGELRVASSASGLWTVTSTGVRSTATTVAAVAMRDRSFVMTLDEGRLILNVETPSGWQRMNTGVEITGEIAAGDLGGLWPTVFVSQGGALYRVWGDDQGWHAEATGIETWGPIALAVSPTGWPEVFSLEGGMLFRAWQDAEGWHEESTGIPANGPISASSVAGSVSVVLSKNDELFEIGPNDAGGWTIRALGINAGEFHTSLNVDAVDPLIIQIG